MFGENASSGISFRTVLMIIAATAAAKLLYLGKIMCINKMQ